MNLILKKQSLRLLSLIWLAALVCCTQTGNLDVPLAVNTSQTEETATPELTTPSKEPTQTVKPELVLEETKVFSSVETTSLVTQKPTNTVTPTIISLTPLPSATPIPSSLNGPLIAFDALNAESGKYVILVFDTSTGTSREYTPEQLGGTIVGFDWSQNGCELFVAVRKSGGVQYVPIDLAGNVGEPFSQIISSTVEEGDRYEWSISSTKEWIAFLLGFGVDEEGFDYGYKDTWVIKNAPGNDPPIALTHNSLTNKPIWSFSGDRLAYTGYDAAGIPQLFHSAPDGSDQIQLTEFSEPIDHIEGIRWSPDGSWLSFATYNDADALAPGESFLWSIARDGQSLNRVELGDFVIRQSPWWSSDSDSYSAYVELWAEEASRGFQGGKIVWVNPQDGIITHEFVPNEIQFEHVFPVGGNEVIGFLGTKYVIYDKAEKIVEIVSDSPFELVYPREITPLIGPYDFKGEENCN